MKPFLTEPFSQLLMVRVHLLSYWHFQDQQSKKNEPMTEAEGMARYLEQNGIAAERILLEDQSKTTQQNMEFSRKLIPEGASLGVVTNNFHLYRAMQIAKRQGLVQAVGIAAPSSGKYLANNMLREFFGWLKMVLLD